MYFKVANADGGFKKELSDRNQAHHSVCGNAGHYIMGASLGTRNKYFSRTFTLPDTLYNSGLLNSTIGIENVAAWFNMLTPQSLHVSKKHVLTHLHADQS